VFKESALLQSTNNLTIQHKHILVMRKQTYFSLAILWKLVSAR